MSQGAEGYVATVMWVLVSFAPTGSISSQVYHLNVLHSSGLCGSVAIASALTLKGGKLDFWSRACAWIASLIPKPG